MKQMIPGHDGVPKYRTFYKITGPDGSACSGGKWKFSLPFDGKPGKWTPMIEHPTICEDGYHVVEAAHIKDWARPFRRVFEVETRGGYQWDRSGNKVTWGSIRLIREVGAFPSGFRSIIPYTNAKERTTGQILAILAKGSDEMWDQDDKAEREYRAEEKRKYKEKMARRKAEYSEALDLYRSEVKAYNEKMAMFPYNELRPLVKKVSLMGDDRMSINFIRGFLAAHQIRHNWIDGEEVFKFLRSAKPSKPVRGWLR